DPALPVGALPVARVYVEAGATGIANDRIAVIRADVPNVGFEQMTSLLELAEDAKASAAADAEQAASDREAVELAKDEVVAAKNIASASATSAAGSASAAADAAAILTSSTMLLEPIEFNGREIRI